VDLNASDVDSAATFVVQTGVAGSKGYGTFSIAAGGAWTYTMNNAHDEFMGGADYTDSITVATADGTTQVLTVTLHGTNDAAVITGSSITESSISFVASDPDNGTLELAPPFAAAFGNPTITSTSTQRF
jgi:VCBS repeat-containing protein